MAYNYVTVTGSFPGQSGTITFTPPPEVTDLTRTIQVLGPGPTTCILSGGSFTSAPLLASDNVGLLPAAWNYTATVALAGQRAYSYPVLIPSVPATVSLAALPVSASGGGSSEFLSPMTTPGDMIAGGAGGTAVRLAGNTSAGKQFLTQTGTGSASAQPAWGTIATADVPVLNQNTTGSAGSLSTTPSPAVMGTPGPASGGYVAWTGDYAASGALAGAAGAYPSGSATLTRMDVPPGITINGFLSFSWQHNGSMANSFLGAYSSGGTLLGTGTTDQSSQATALQRVSLGGVTTTPADGIMYIVFVNGTGGVAGGPLYFAAMGTSAIQFRLSAPFRCSHYTGGTLTSLPGSLNYAANFATVPPHYAYGWYAID